MSRSYRHTPVFSWGRGKGEQWWKRHAHRCLRRATQRALLYGREMPLLREVSNAWTWPKDGKTHWWWALPHERISGAYRKIMRK